MGTTSFYMGSLRYGPTGKKRKNHAANPVKRKSPRTFTPMKMPGMIIVEGLLLDL